MMNRWISLGLVAALTTGLSLGSVGCGSDDDAVQRTFAQGSNFVDVLDTTMHFVQRGEGRPILLIHGNPTSSFLWRNVTPHLSGLGRTIAVDLVGHGDSGKPDIDYRFPTQLAYLEEFIAELDLRDVILVLHDWGGGLGFAYADRHPENIAGIAFMETLVRPFTTATVPPFFAGFLTQFRDPVLGPMLIIDQNFFVEVLLGTAGPGGLSEEVLDVYRAPFLDPADRKPILVWPNEIPIDGDPADNAATMASYYRYLQTDPVPKLWLYAEPGVLLPSAEREALEALPNLESVLVGSGLHYIQEDQPDAIGAAIADWIDRVL